jgi:hypothetical protein
MQIRDTQFCLSDALINNIRKSQVGRIKVQLTYQPLFQSLNVFACSLIFEHLSVLFMSSTLSRFLHVTTNSRLRSALSLME